MIETHDCCLSLQGCPDGLFGFATDRARSERREANITQLQWTQVDQEHGCARIHPDQSKSRRAISVPLNADALAVLERRRRKPCETAPDYVFSFRRKPVKKADTKV